MKLKSSHKSLIMQSHTLPYLGTLNLQTHKQSAIGKVSAI